LAHFEGEGFRVAHQVREAARSAPRNIAKGFGRFKHRDVAKFVRIAKASEVEVMNHLQEARLRLPVRERTRRTGTRHAEGDQRGKRVDSLSGSDA
jgi:four helix bundle protein